MSGIPKLSSRAHGGTDRLTFFVATDSARSAAYRIRLQLENSSSLACDLGQAEREAQDIEQGKVFQVDVTVRERSG
jgi:hypothetical protein